ncbi:MAG: FAD:protein FMN transferase [Planctomycetes bacterium]|nr:FAD:protein FMN transferase [Planctomycetota bacterium]MBI4007219.1 FAD:protein FMN transferase [Planctomycetota bacterium]
MKTNEIILQANKLTSLQACKFVGLLACWLICLLPFLTGCRKGSTQEIVAENHAGEVYEPSLQQFKETRMLMGTLVSVTVFERSGDTSKEVIDLAFNRIAEIENLMSNYKEDSELSMVNQKASAEFVPLTQDTFTVIKKAIEFSRLSRGAFDITCGPLCNLWRDAGKSGRLPANEELEKILSTVGYKKINLDTEKQALSFQSASGGGVELDVGGIAKGYAVDEAIKVLKGHGIESALVDAGGDLYALGTKPGGEPWHIGIQDPYHPDDTETFLGKLKINDCAVATSGDYQRFMVINGKKYSHIVNPLTGLPVENVPSVTVIANDATTADALATALSVMGAKEGIELAKSIPGVEALIVSLSNNQLQYTRTPNFAAFETR